MRTRLLPNTELDLSVVGFGSWAIGGTHWGDDIDDDQSVRAIHCALDLGINWIDTAPIYGAGHSEEIVGRAVADRRGKVIIASKVGVSFGDDGHAHSTLTRDWIATDVENSLQRLGADTIDLLQVHWPCELDTPLEESFGALAALITQGKVRHVGVCNYPADKLARIKEICPIVSEQVGYSLLRREIEAEIIPEVRRLSLGLLAYEPLGRGLLTGKFTHPPSMPNSDLRSFDDRFKGHRFEHARRLTQDLAKVARRLQVPTAAVAIAWVASRPGVTSVIAGAKRAEQVEQNVLAARVLDFPKALEVVDRIGGIHGGTPP